MKSTFEDVPMATPAQISIWTERLIECAGTEDIAFFKGEDTGSVAQYILDELIESCRTPEHQGFTLALPNSVVIPPAEDIKRALQYPVKAFHWYVSQINSYVYQICVMYCI